MTKTTPEHFQTFKDECQKWIRELGLLRWDVVFEHKKDTENYATCSVNLTGMKALLCLSTEWDVEPTNELIMLSAKEETLHLLLGRLRINAMTRFVNQAEVEEAEEEIVKLLCKVIK